MKLIVDSGSTKAAWALAQNGAIQHCFTSAGISPYFMDDAAIRTLVAEVRAQLGGTIPAELHYYGTGCNALEQRHRLEQLFSNLFPETPLVRVYTDIAGAARACCQHEAGITGILGTGSNACRYDGREVLETAGGLGFILGDEGSGAAIGRELLIAFLNRELPGHSAQALQERFQLTRDNILQSVYKLPFPNRYLAAFMPFVYAHRAEPAVQALLERQFLLFFQRNILPLQTPEALPVHLVGSVAYFFKEEIQQSAQLVSLSLGSIARDPIPGLAQYHR
jgi:N-acetylglucosamine kinase-like BadF-type ATPase